MAKNTNKSNELETKKSLILAIVNHGYSDLVMNAARKAGARGGTVASARGTADPDMASFYGITLTPEKDMVYMVVDSVDRDRIMGVIYEDAGLKSRGNGILFSLPITDAVGLEPAVTSENDK
jgi:nitrogen regulatory protein PII